MAQYKGREVTIIKELPHPNGDQAQIEHKDLALGVEIVPRKDVTLTDAEMKEIKKVRESSEHNNEFKIAEEHKHTGTMSIPKPKAL